MIWSTLPACSSVVVPEPDAPANCPVPPTTTASNTSVAGLPNDTTVPGASPDCPGTEFCGEFEQRGQRAAVRERDDVEEFVVGPDHERIGRAAVARDQARSADQLVIRTRGELAISPPEMLREVGPD